MCILFTIDGNVYIRGGVEGREPSDALKSFCFPGSKNLRLIESLCNLGEPSSAVACGPGDAHVIGRGFLTLREVLGRPASFCPSAGVFQFADKKGMVCSNESEIPSVQERLALLH